MRFLFKALLAATALIPVATVASAQDAPRERRETRGGDVVERGDRGNRAERAERRAARQAPEQAQRVDVDRDVARGRDRMVERVPRVDANGQTRGEWNRGERRTVPGPAIRADAGAEFREARAARRDARLAQRQRNAEQSFRDYGRTTGDWNRQRADRDDRRRDDRRFDGNRNDRNDWNRQRADRDDRRRDDRRFDNRSAWNRSWRNDRRYDWGGYRAGNRSAYRLPRYYAPSGWGYGYRRFSVGVTLNSVLWGQNYWIEDPYNYRLPEAYGPYRWVRYYNDALLVDVRYGEVIDVVHDIFW